MLVRPANEGVPPPHQATGPSPPAGKPGRLRMRCPKGFQPAKGSSRELDVLSFLVSRRMTSRQNAGIGSVEYHPAEAGASRIHAFPFFFAGFTRSWRCHQTPKAGKARISKSHIHWKHLTFYNSIRYPKSHNGSGSACLYGWTDSCDVGGAIGTASAQSQWSRWEDGLGNAADGD